MSRKPLTTDQLKAYKERIDGGGLSEVRQVYAEMYAQGYNYAGWAGGVANGSSITGVSALEYLKGTALLGIGADACKNLSDAQIDSIRLSMGKGYIDTLIDTPCDLVTPSHETSITKKPSLSTKRALRPTASAWTTGR